MMKEEAIKPINDFDDILTYVGGWGRFQYMITLVNFLFNIFLGYVYLSPILTLYTPPHWCAVPELANLSLEARREVAIPKDEAVLGDYKGCSHYSCYLTIRRVQPVPAVHH